MSILFIDADSELPFEKVRELNFDEKFIIKMPYTICDKEVFSDLGPGFNAKEFFDLERKGNLPITSGLNTEIYKEYFEKYFAEGEDILYVSFSTEMSGTFKYHDIAIEELSKKYPAAKYRRFDTKGISNATGIQCYYAIKMHNEGKSNDEIIISIFGCKWNYDYIFGDLEIYLYHLLVYRLLHCLCLLLYLH